MNAAIDWRLRLRHGGSDEWAHFTRWLEEHPANAGAYDRVAVLDDELDGVSVPSNRAELNVDRFFPPRTGPAIHVSKLFGSGVAIVAAATLTALVWQPWGQSELIGKEITTRPGERRTIQLADGSSVALNGNSHIRLSDARNGVSELISGEALFRIRHSADQPFVIKVGDDRIEDLGTTFNVVRDKDQIRVEVAEGIIRYRRGNSGIKLHGGQTLNVEPRGDALVGRKTPLDIGGWNAGQLVYEAVPLMEVAKDLGRNLGVNVSVSPDLALQQFTGSINLKGRPEQVITSFSSTIAARPRKTEAGWLIH